MNKREWFVLFCISLTPLFLRAQNMDSVKYEYAFINRWVGRVKLYYENKPSENLRERLALNPSADNDSIISHDIFKVIHYMEGKGYELFLFSSYESNKRYLFRKKIQKTTK